MFLRVEDDLVLSLPKGAVSTKENLGDFIHTSSGHSSCQALYPIEVNGLLELLIGCFLFQDVSGISTVTVFFQIVPFLAAEPPLCFRYITYLHMYRPTYLI